MSAVKYLKCPFPTFSCTHKVISHFYFKFCDLAFENKDNQGGITFMLWALCLFYRRTFWLSLLQWASL